MLNFNQTTQNYLGVFFQNDPYNLTKFDKIQNTGIAIFKQLNTGGYLLNNWNTKCDDEKNNGKIHNFIKSTKTSSSTGYSAATSLPHFGNSFMYIKTSQNNSSGENVFVSFERTDFIQITKITFYCNRFSFLTINSLEAMDRFRVQLLLSDITWNTRYNIPKNDQCSNSSTDWTLVSLNFTAEIVALNWYTIKSINHMLIYALVILQEHILYTKRIINVLKVCSNKSQILEGW